MFLFRPTILNSGNSTSSGPAEIKIDTKILEKVRNQKVSKIKNESKIIKSRISTKLSLSGPTSRL